VLRHRQSWVQDMRCQRPWRAPLALSSCVKIRATLVGALVPATGWQGAVLAVFPRAVNIAVDTYCISLVCDQQAMTSLSITVPGLFQPARQGLRAALQPATVVYMVGAHLRLAIDAATRLDIALTGAARWDGSLRASDVSGLALHRTDTLARLLCRHGRAGGMLGLYAGETATHPLLWPTIVSLRTEAERPQDGLSRLVGRGIGLTPSGDDFLTGVLLADCMVRYAGSAYCLPIDRQQIASALERTNTAGRTLLWQALQGAFPAYLLALAGWFSGAQAVSVASLESAEADFEPCLVRMLAHGHTSGTDAVVGFLWYLERLKGMSRV
jgi:Protein of unknown function (DUF2877)